MQAFFLSQLSESNVQHTILEDVGGSFRNHFASKDEFLKEVDTLSFLPFLKTSLFCGVNIRIYGTKRDCTARPMMTSLVSRQTQQKSHKLEWEIILCIFTPAL